MDNLLFFFLSALGLLISTCNITLAGAQGVGVNYGRLGDNLPPPDQVISLYKSRNIGKMRLFAPDADVLTALHGSGIELVLGTLNADLQPLATDPAFAANWVQTHIIPHADSVAFRYIVVGNEVISGPGDDLSQWVVPAMQNMDRALLDAHVSLKVSTAVPMSVLGPSPVPSQGVFSDVAASAMSQVIGFLVSRNYPLLLNAYPYFAYDPANMRLEYAILNSTEVIVKDGELGYTNLLHAMVDTVYTAMEKVDGGESVEVVLAETGWPSGGGPEKANLEYARVHNNNAVAMAAKRTATPKRPGRGVETYVFAMFNENQKPEGTERNFGLYRPDKTEVYHVDFP